MKFILLFVVLLFSFLMIYITFLNYKKNFFTLLENIIWQIIWIFAIFLSLRPKSVDIYIEVYFQTNFFYVLTILGIFFLILTTFYFYTTIKILEKKIDKLIRSEALKDFFKNN